MHHLISFFVLCSESDNQVLLFDNQEAEIILKIYMKNTSGRAITLFKGGTIASSLVCTIQEISSFKIISLASNEEGKEGKMNIPGGNYVEKQNINVGDIDSIEYEESYQNQECDDNLMEYDSHEQWTHHNPKQKEHTQPETPAVLSQISEQQSSQIKEDQRKKEALLFKTKDEPIPKCKKVEATPTASDIENKELKQRLDVVKRESEQFKAYYFSRQKKDQQNEEMKKKTNARAQIKRNRTKNLKDYVRVHLRGWEVQSPINHLDSNRLMKFKLRPSDCTIPGSVSFTDDKALNGTVSPANLIELEKLRK